MNYIDLIIGLGLGVLIALIIRFFVDDLKARRTKEREHHAIVCGAIERTADFQFGNKALYSSLLELKQRIEKLESSSSRIKPCVDRIDQHAERIERLEQFKKDSELSLPIIADRLETLEKRRK